MNREPNRIDVHHHVLTPEWLAAAAKAGHRDAGGIAFPAWSAESDIAMMDRKGIATAIASVSAPGVHLGGQTVPRDLARRSNEHFARLIADHPERFGAFAAVPQLDVDGTLSEMTYALDTLKLDGVGFLASVDGKYLGDPDLDPIFAELNRRKAVVFVHPNDPPPDRATGLDFPGTLTEFVFDTTRAAANLIFSGTLERYPDVRIILAHAGGTVPFLAWRLSLGDTSPKLREKAPQGVLAYLRRFYYETALSANPFALSSLQELADPSRIVFGSDHPYLPEPLIGAQVQGLDNFAGFDDAKRRRIERENALALFPRLAGVTVRS